MARRKNLMFVATVLASVGALVSCGGPSSSTSSLIGSSSTGLSSVTTVSSNSVITSTTTLTSTIATSASSSEKIAVTWNGLTDAEVVVGDSFDWLAGVSAVDQNGNALEVSVDATVKAQIEGATGPTLKLLKYYAYKNAVQVGDAGQRKVTVIWGYKVPNGDFSQGLTGFGTTYNSPSVGTVSYDDTQGAVKYVMTEAGTEAWQVQTEYDGAVLTKGTTYKYSVDAWAADAKSVGKSVALGFEDLDNGYAMLIPASVEFAVTQDKQTFSIYYTADKNYSNVKVALYLGRGLDADDTATVSNPLSWYVDNISIAKVDSAGITFTGYTTNSSHRFAVKSKVETETYKNALTATNASGVDVTNKLTWVGTMPNALEATRSVTNVGYEAIYKDGDKVSAAFVGFDWSNPALTRDYDYKPYNADFSGGFLAWNRENLTSSADNGNGTVTISVIKKAGSDADWTAQLQQSAPNLKAGTTYKLSLKLRIAAGAYGIVRTEFDASHNSNAKTDINLSELADGEWHEFDSIDYTPAADVSNARIGLLLGDSASSASGISFSMDLDYFTVAQVAAV